MKYRTQHIAQSLRTARHHRDDTQVGVSMLKLFRRPKKITRRFNEVRLIVEIEQETDGRWIADVPDLPGVLVYGTSQKGAFNKAAVLALRVLADRLEHDETAEPPMSFSLIPRECLAGH